MSEQIEKEQAQVCPMCGNHCPANALQCGRGRKYFGAADIHGQDPGHGHGGHLHHGHRDGMYHRHEEHSR